MAAAPVSKLSAPFISSSIASPLYPGSSLVFHEAWPAITPLRQTWSVPHWRNVSLRRVNCKSSLWVGITPSVTLIHSILTECAITLPIRQSLPMPDSKRHAQLASPHIRLLGIVDQAMYDNFRQQLEACPATEPIIITITTLGGDPEVARTMGAASRRSRPRSTKSSIRSPLRRTGSGR